MPKLKEPPDTIAARHLVATIEGRCRFYGVTNPQLAKAAGITVPTLRDRLRNPKDFKYKELLGIAVKLKFDAEDVCNALGVKYSPVVIADARYIVKGGEHNA